MGWEMCHNFAIVESYLYPSLKLESHGWCCNGLILQDPISTPHCNTLSWPLCCNTVSHSTTSCVARLSMIRLNHHVAIPHLNLPVLQHPLHCNALCVATLPSASQDCHDSAQPPCCNTLCIAIPNPPPSQPLWCNTVLTYFMATSACDSLKSLGLSSPFPPLSFSVTPAQGACPLSYFKFALVVMFKILLYLVHSTK